MPGRKKRGQQTVVFDNPPVLTAWAAVVGPKEGEGPWGQDFDYVLDDYLYGEQTWELAEYKMLRETVKMALNKRNLLPEDVDLLLAGDLLNQIVASNFAAGFGDSIYGLIRGLLTMAESLSLGAMLLDGDYYERVVAAACIIITLLKGNTAFPPNKGCKKPLPLSGQPQPGLLPEASGSGPGLKGSR